MSIGVDPKPALPRVWKTVKRYKAPGYPDPLKLLKDQRGRINNWWVSATDVMSTQRTDAISCFL